MKNSELIDLAKSIEEGKEFETIYVTPFHEVIPCSSEIPTLDAKKFVDITAFYIAMSTLLIVADEHDSKAARKTFNELKGLL